MNEKSFKILFKLIRKAAGWGVGGRQYAFGGLPHQCWENWSWNDRLQSRGLKWCGRWDGHSPQPPRYSRPSPWPVSSVSESCLTDCDAMDCSMPGLPVHHQLPGLTQTHVHWVGDAIQPSHPLSSPSLPTLSLSQDQGLFQWAGSSHQVAKVLEFQLQHQSFQWIFRTDLL